jgi:hypothetical protein
LKPGAYLEQLTTWLETDAALPGKKRKRTAQRLYEYLQVEGYVWAVTTARCSVS